MNKNNQHRWKLALLAVCCQCVCGAASAAVAHGPLAYSGHYNGPKLQQNVTPPPFDITLPAYVGLNTVFYHDANHVHLEKSEIDTLVDHFDYAMSLYRQYGNRPLHGKRDNQVEPQSGKGSVILRILPENGPAAGLGANGKAEVFKTSRSAVYFDSYPTDIRTWLVGFYELGRGTRFPIYEYFVFGGGVGGMNSGFPLFITYSIYHDQGFPRNPDQMDSPWSGEYGLYPGLMETRLLGLLEMNDFADFYKDWDKVVEETDPIKPFVLYGDTNEDGFIDTRNKLEFVGLNDAQGVIFSMLRDLYGHEFMVDFFDYAMEGAVLKKPTNGLSALCNIVDAGNAALYSYDRTPVSENRIGQLLTQRLRFPSCEPSDSIVWDFEEALSWVNKGDFPFLSGSSTTPSWGTGPLQASSGTQYLFFETSGGGANRQGDTAIIESPILRPGEVSLMFDYHMFGKNMGTLSVDVYRDQKWEEIWSRSGQIHSSEAAPWSTETLEITPYHGHSKVRFRAVAAGAYQGDLAIDNVKIVVEPVTFAIENRWKRWQQLDVGGVTTWYAREVPGTALVYLCDGPKSNRCLHIENGHLEVSEILSGWWSAQWHLESAQNDYFRIANKWKPTHYIHNQNGSFEASPVESGWWSAQWSYPR